MNSPVPVTRKTSLAGIALEQNERGYVLSPWFTYDWKQEMIGHEVAYSGRMYQAVRSASVTAFAERLGINPRDVVVSEKRERDSDECWWRLGSRHPLPKLQPQPKPAAPDGVIDV